jgi:hypothetical protein
MTMMKTSLVMDRGKLVAVRGKSGAELVAGTVQQLPVLRLARRRRSRTERVTEALQSLPPAARVGLVAAAAGVAIGLAVVARKRLFAAAAVVAEAVEEAADAVEDAAEDVAEAARKRTDSTKAS